MTAPVAVVIPVWDAYVRWLPEAVDSVLAQGTGVEVVVVDNASEETVPRLPWTTVLRSERRMSTGAARNAGLDAVRAPLVVFLDADDVMLPGSLEALSAGIGARPDAVACAMGIVDGETGGRHRSPRRIARGLARFPRPFAVANSLWSLLPTQGATIMRTDAVIAAGRYADRSQGEDWALAAALAWGGRVVFGQEPVLVYRWRGDSPGRASASAVLRSNARAVRERLRTAPGVPGGVRRALPTIAVGQWLIVAVVRPLVRGLRISARARPAAAARWLPPRRGHSR